MFSYSILYNSWYTTQREKWIFMFSTYSCFLDLDHFHFSLFTSIDTCQDILYQHELFFYTIYLPIHYTKREMNIHVFSISCFLDLHIPDLHIPDLHFPDLHYFHFSLFTSIDTYQDILYQHVDPIYIIYLPIHYTKREMNITG